MPQISGPSRAWGGWREPSLSVGLGNPHVACAPGQFLRWLDHVLAEPVSTLAGRIADTRLRPDLWLIHWILP
eukprot:16445126-Heterocapsa_arctica.AAC.1